MFVLSIDDDGDERNFLAEAVEIERLFVGASICGAKRYFGCWDIMDIVAVDTLSSLVVRDLDGGLVRRDRLC